MAENTLDQIEAKLKQLQNQQSKQSKVSLSNCVRFRATTDNRVEQLVDEQKETIRTLKGKLKASRKEFYEMQVEALDDDDGAGGEDTDHSSSGSNAVLPDPIEDPNGLYCCVQCSFEVVDGECQSCFTLHNWTTVGLPA